MTWSPDHTPLRRPSSAIAWLAAALGVCTFLPLGLNYLLLFTLTAAIALDTAHRQGRLSHLGAGSGWGILLLVSIAWPLLTLAGSSWYDDSTPTRLFHIVRVAWVLTLGLLLLPHERRHAFIGFMVGAVLAGLVVIAHHLWTLPEWAIWKNLLSVRGNHSSQKMIMMACAASVAFWLAIRPSTPTIKRWLLIALWLALSAVVAMFSLSRNAHLLLGLLPLAALLYRTRSIRRFLAAGTLIILAVVVAWNTSSTIQPRFQAAVTEWRALVDENNYNSSVGVRGKMYQVAWQGMVEHPWLGTGIGSWQTHWSQASTEFPELSGMNNPHNDFLLTGLETGIPGLLIMTALLLAFALKAWQAQNTLGGIGFMLTMATILTALVNAPLRDAGLGMSLIWLMAVAIAPTAQSQASHRMNVQ